MRMSRRSVLTKRRGIRWQKWSCTRTSSYHWGIIISDEYSLVSQPIADDRTFVGTTSYSQSQTTGDLSSFGSNITLGKGDFGTVYDVMDPRLMAYAFVNRTVYSAYVVRPSQYLVVTYSKGSTSYGNVYADEGAYPDADAGYTYVTHFSSGGIDYKVMRSGTTYYCYNLA